MKNTISGNEGRGFMKIIVDPSNDRIVGLHVIGPECAEIVQARIFNIKLPVSAYECLECMYYTWVLKTHA